jgi:hypothetical protein
MFLSLDILFLFLILRVSLGASWIRDSRPIGLLELVGPWVKCLRYWFRHNRFDFFVSMWSHLKTNFCVFGGRLEEKCACTKCRPWKEDNLLHLKYLLVLDNFEDIVILKTRQRNGRNHHYTFGITPVGWPLTIELFMHGTPKRGRSGFSFCDTME